MLRGELGDARFWRSIARYVHDNAQRSVETIDLIRAIEHATGRNLREFFNQWVFGRPSGARRARRLGRVAQGRDPHDRSEAARRRGEPGVRFRRRDRVRAFRKKPLHERSGDSRPRRARARDHLDTARVRAALVRFDPGAHLLGDVTYALAPISRPPPCAAIRTSSDEFAPRASSRRTADERLARHSQRRSSANPFGAFSPRLPMRSARREHPGRAAC